MIGAIGICLLMVCGSLAVLNFSTRPTGETGLNVAQNPTYYDWAGWDGNRSIYLTDYTGYTFLPSTSNYSFQYQLPSNSSFTGQGMNLANAEEVSVSTGPSLLYSYYTYTPVNGWTLVLNVTDSGTTTPIESYNGGWFWAFAWFEDMIATLYDGPVGHVQTTIYTSYDDGINVSDSGSYIVSSGTAGNEWEAWAIAAGLDAVAVAVGAVPGADAVDFAVVPSAAAATTEAFEASTEAGEYSSSSLTSSTNEAGGNATVNQWAQIVNPTASDYEYSQSTRLEVSIGPNSNGLLPILGYGGATLELSAFPQLGDNRSGPGNWQDTADGSSPSLTYGIFPAVSLEGNVTTVAGTAAAGATVLLQQSCPSGSEFPSANYYEQANSAGQWHFFGAPGCTYTYSASVPYSPQGGQTLTGSAVTFSEPASAAGTNRWVAPYNIGWKVTFSETGAPSGDQWSVKANGETLSASAGTNIVFVEPNGTYSYSITAPSGYGASPSSGSVTVSGGSASVATTISKLATYSVTFSESGLPSGDSWEVTVGGTLKSADAPTSIGFSGLSGSNSYTVGDVVVLANGCVLEYYGPSPASGTVSGATTVAVTYTYHVTTEVHKCAQPEGSSAATLFASQSAELSANALVALAAWRA